MFGPRIPASCHGRALRRLLECNCSREATPTPACVYQHTRVCPQSKTDPRVAKTRSDCCFVVEKKEQRKATVEHFVTRVFDIARPFQSFITSGFAIENRPTDPQTSERMANYLRTRRSKGASRQFMLIFSAVTRCGSCVRQVSLFFWPSPTFIFCSSCPICWTCRLTCRFSAPRWSSETLPTSTGFK